MHDVEVKEDQFLFEERKASERPGLTLREIALIMGISHERVNQILKQALKKLKKKMDRDGIKIEDLLGS